MAERRYSFQFSLLEGGMLFLSVLLASFLVFLFGVYVGRGVEARKTAQDSQAVRARVVVPEESPPHHQFPETGTLAWPVSKEKPTIAQTSSPSTTPALATPLQNSATQVSGAVLPPPLPVPSTVAENRAPATSQSSVVSPPVLSDPGPVTLAEKSAVSFPRPDPVAAPPQSSPNGTTSPPDRQKPVERAKRWKVQVEATTQGEAAQNTAKTLREQGYEASVSQVMKQGQVWYRVRVGKFASQEEAVAAIAQFRRDGKFSQAYLVSE